MKTAADIKLNNRIVKYIAFAGIGIAALGLVGFGAYKMVPAKYLPAAIAPDPRMQDLIFSYAVNLAKGMADIPICVQRAKMILNYADPRNGSPDYRQMAVDRIFDKVPEFCVAGPGARTSPEILQYIAQTREDTDQERNDTGTNVAPAVVAKPTVALDPFVINLADEDKSYLLQVSIALNMSDPAGATIANMRAPEIRNRVLMLLSSKKITDFETPEGKQKVLAELVIKLNEPLSGGDAVMNVESAALTNFLVSESK